MTAYGATGNYVLCPSVFSIEQAVCGVGSRWKDNDL